MTQEEYDNMDIYGKLKNLHGTCESIFRNLDGIINEHNYNTQDYIMEQIEEFEKFCSFSYNDEELISKDSFFDTLFKDIKEIIPLIKTNKVRYIVFKDYLKMIVN